MQRTGSLDASLLTVEGRGPFILATDDVAELADQYVRHIVGISICGTDSWQSPNVILLISAFVDFMLFCMGGELHRSLAALELLIKSTFGSRLLSRTGIIPLPAAGIPSRRTAL